MITLEVRLANDNRIELTLEYSGDQPVEVYQSALPWGNRYSLILVAVKADALGAPEPQGQVIDDPGAAAITIQPGDRLTGEIDLNERFSGFDDLLKTRDVILFWSYEMRTVENAAPPRIGGWLLIPKEND